MEVRMGSQEYPGHPCCLELLPVDPQYISCQLAFSGFSGGETVAELVSDFDDIMCRYEHIMNNLLNFFIAILVVGWLIGFLAFNIGGLIHLLLVVAVIVFLLKIIAGKP